VQSIPPPTTGARVTGPAYREALVALVGAEDPLAIMETLPSWLARETGSVPDDVLRTPEQPGKWSILEVVEHLADAELVHSYRIRMILTYDRPTLPGYDQNLWAARFGYNEGELHNALSVVNTLRDHNMRLLRRVEGHDLDRLGLHSERGPESLRDTMLMTAGHDLVHRRQITRIKDRLGIR